VAMDFLAGAPAGAGPPPGGGGDPLAALLGPQGPPPDGRTAGVDPGGSELDALDDILVACRAYMAIPTVEESERLEMEKVTTIVQKLKAQNEKMADEVTGGSPAIRKALGAPA
jgi:hypothetical protein